MYKYSIKPIPSEMRLILAEKVRMMRKQAGYSQAETAQRSGVSLGSLKRFERTGQISLDSLLRLAYLFDRVDEFAALFNPQEDMRRIEKLFRD